MAEKRFLDVRDIAAETEIRREEPKNPSEQQKVTPPGYLAVKFAFSPSRGDMGGAF